MYKWRAKARIILCMQDDLNLRILRMFEGTFPLEEAQNVKVSDRLATISFHIHLLFFCIYTFKYMYLNS